MRVKFTLVIVLAAFYVNGNPLVEKIIANHIEACGGQSNWDRVEALELRGSFSGFSVEKELLVIKTRKGEFYSDYHLGKNRIREGYDGTTFWTIDPWQEMEFARRINRHEQHVILQKAELFTPFYRWKERGFIVEYKGKEIVDDVEMEVLVLTRPGMTDETWYINAQTYLPYKSISRWVDFAVGVNGETFYDDYRSVNGLLLPHFIEQTYSTRHTTTRIKEVFVNPLVDSSRFAMPLCEHMNQLLSLQGTWKTQVEYMTRRGAWQTFDTIKSTFTHCREKNTLHGVVSYEVNFPISNSYTINYNRQTNNYQLTVYEDLYSSSSVYRGSLDEGKVVFDSEEVRYIINFNGETGFTLERKRSPDNGVTWQEVERLTFMRDMH